MALVAPFQCNALGCQSARKVSVPPRNSCTMSPLFCRTPFQAASNGSVSFSKSHRSQYQSVSALSKAVAIAQMVEEEEATLPAGFERYEIMLILRPTLSDEERDKELAKFEAFLNMENCKEIDTIVRGRCRMAYAIRGNWDGIYVLYNCAARRSTAKAIQQLLANPDSGSEENVLRFMILRRTGPR